MSFETKIFVLQSEDHLLVNYFSVIKLTLHRVYCSICTIADVFPTICLECSKVWIYDTCDDCSVETVGRVFASAKNEDAKRINSSVNCGVAADCGVNAFPVHIHSGIENYELPKICINGI